MGLRCKRCGSEEQVNNGLMRPYVAVATGEIGLVLGG